MNLKVTLYDYSGDEIVAKCDKCGSKNVTICQSVDCVHIHCKECNLDPSEDNEFKFEPPKCGVTKDAPKVANETWEINLRDKDES